MQENKQREYMKASKIIGIECSAQLSTKLEAGPKLAAIGSCAIILDIEVAFSPTEAQLWSEREDDSGSIHLSFNAHSLHFNR